MKNDDIRREGPASTNHEKIDFRNFHDHTRAHFAPATPPPREPDFVSSGRSVYWDMGDGVLRASDHWSFQNGCASIASCVWTYDGICRPGEWEAGFCRYEAFTRRRREIPFRPAEAIDIRLARMLLDHGGLDPTHWRSMSEGAPLPGWARIAPRGTLAAASAEAFFRKNPDLPRAVTADRLTILKIIDEEIVPLPARMSC